MTPMFKNYLKLAWRNLLKDRQFTILNLSGLAVGLACALLIGLWIADEWSMEKYNPNDARLYQVRTNQKMENGIETGMYTPGILAKALKADLPEVEDASEVLAASWFICCRKNSWGSFYWRWGLLFPLPGWA
jgi:putative ABC transport system permease protein